MNKFKARFTKWYIKRGYRFIYNFNNVPVYHDGFLSTPCGMPEILFICPWWVKPFLIFFSPSVYSAETIGKIIADALAEGMRAGEDMKKGDEDNELS